MGEFESTSSEHPVTNSALTLLLPCTQGFFTHAIDRMGWSNLLSSSGNNNSRALSTEPHTVPNCSDIRKRSKLRWLVGV